MDVVRLDSVTPFITKDGSEIRELLAHRNSSIRRQSLAEARIPVGSATTAHRHPNTEEIYFLLQGTGLMAIDDQSRLVGPGDAIAIPPGAIHKLTNVGDVELRLLCCCAPGYEHDDTILMDDPTAEQPAADGSTATALNDSLVGPDDRCEDVGG
ncbi:MAG TPA: cupin domain-containing protein [Pirellulaceae bacterium]|nr:cupin domain-containing protein [Pirellulaceae bacterium]